MIPTSSGTTQDIPTSPIGSPSRIHVLTVVPRSARARARARTRASPSTSWDYGQDRDSRGLTYGTCWDVPSSPSTY